MKIRRLRTIMISAYLSAMLVSSVAPVRRDVALAGAVDSTAARQALQSAIAGLNVGGWAPSVTVPASVSLPTAVMAVTSAPQAAEPPISEELMARLIKRTLASKKDAWIIAPVCAIFGMCDGTSNMPVKQILTDKPDGTRYIELPLKEGSKDIVISFKHDNIIEYYLTNKKGDLRAAAISDRTGAGTHLITNEQAAENFKNLIQFLAKLAEKLPPTDVAVAGNS